MTAEQEVLNAIRGVIYGLQPEERETVEKCADVIRKMVAEHTMYGALALALVGAEKAAEA
jgi:hypothetical protein